MCCFFAVLVFLGPRAALALWWLVDPKWFNSLYDTFIWPALGFVFLPTTTLMYTLIHQPNGITGFNWVWIGLAVVADIATHGGSAYGNRNRIPGMSQSSY